MATIAIPYAWFENSSTKAITPDNLRPITTGTGGAVPDSLNFHDCAIRVIAELDALYLDALGLPQRPLITQLYTLCSDSTWKLRAAK